MVDAVKDASVLRLPGDFLAPSSVVLMNKEERLRQLLKISRPPLKHSLDLKVEREKRRRG